MATIVLEEYELLGDSKYRSYMSLVDKALKAFEYTTEWADLIAALGKLNKVLLSHQKYPIVPRRVVISKRLAQCMHPALPSGVHLKALETYDVIFKCMGTNRLAQELFLYSAGLFPLLAHAAMNVRPALLTVYETHFVPLGQRLRPALNGFLSGVLPGLEEGSDHFDRTNHLLESVCEATHPPAFYGALWECMASNASIRLPAVGFILQHLDKRKPVAEQSHLLGNDGDVMVQAVCLAVQDTSVLVQRNALDLLIVAFPLHDANSLLSEEELVKVVAAACSVLLRRDMSLNRRLFNWLLGCDLTTMPAPNPSNKQRAHVRQDSISSTASADSNNASFYFEFYSKSVLVDALILVLSGSLDSGPDSNSSQQYPDLRPFRLLVSLLDKPEIGPLVMDDIIIDVFRTLYHAHKCLGDDEEGRKGKQELAKSSNLLFASFESSYIWEFCGKRFETACMAEERMNDTHEDVNRVGYDQGATVVEMCAIVDFLLDIVSIETYVETYSEQLPALFKTISRAVSMRCVQLTAKEIGKAMLLCKRVLSKVQPAWTAWEVQGGEKIVDEEDSDSEAQPRNTEEEKATKMWSQLSKKGRSPDSSPEMGREATESMPSSPQPNESESSKLGSPGTKLVHQKHEKLMQECVRAFQELFVRVVSEKLLDPNKFSMEDHLSLMVQRPRNTLEERTRQLESLLEERSDLRKRASDGSTPRSSVGRKQDGFNELDAREDQLLDRMRKVSLVLKSEDMAELSQAVTTACKVLVELSSIPTVRKRGRDDTEAVQESPYELPKWLQFLLVCSCLLGRDHSILQLNCVGTLLELISLLQSTLAASRDGEDFYPYSPNEVRRGGGGQRDANVAIVMMPLVEESHYHCIMSKTIVPQVIASKLWEGLGTLPPSLHLKCVALLHQLHNLVPDSRQIERILARSLGGCSLGQHQSLFHGRDGGTVGSSKAVVDAYQRFTLLWHLSRDQESKRAAGRAPARTFDICLLKMLDNLNLSSGPLKALSQSWLVHAVAKGDIARLMEPLFLTLLDPSTSRVSVLHAKIEQIDTVDGSRYGEVGIHHVYSIRSSNQEVIYHVSEKRGRTWSSDDSDVTNNKSNADKAKKIFALARFKNSSNSGGGNASNSAVSPVSSRKSDDLPMGLTAIPLLVNPFALVPADLEEFSFYTKGYSSSSEALKVKRSPSMASTTSSSTTASPSLVDASFETDEVSESLTHQQARSMMEDILGGVVKDVIGRVISYGGDKTDSKDTVTETTLDSMEELYRSGGGVGKSLNIHPLHSHLLLYTQVCDSRQVLYAMQCVKNILLTNPRLSLCMLSTTKLNSSSSGGSPRAGQLHMLLARHRKSVFGKNFAGSLSSDNMVTYRNANLIEVLISTLLYFLRSYYPNLGHMRLTEEEILSNREVQLISIDILSVLVSELVSVVQDNSKAYATYISDLFSRCKVQKVVLHSMLACINDMRDSPKRQEEQEVLAFTEDVLRFNEIYSAPGGQARDRVSGSGERISNYSEAFQVQVLRLLLALVMLEQAISQQRGQMPPEKLKPLQQTSPSPSTVGGSNVLRYHSDHDIPDQPMFLAAIVSALRQEKMRHLHSHWTSLFTSCLPFLGRSLSQSVLEVASQLSKNLESLACFYDAAAAADEESQQEDPANVTFGQIPADYVVTQMEALTMVYHYCLLDSGSAQAGATAAQTTPGSGGQQQALSPQQQHQQNEILSNLLHVFLSNTDSKNLTANSVNAPASVDTLAIARKILLSTLPRLVNTVAILWKAVVNNKSSDSSCACILVGSPRVVQTRLLDLVSPIAAQHPVSFLAAVAIAWQERRTQGNLAMSKHPLPHCNEDQRVLVDLCGAIRSLPVPTVLQTVRQVLKSPPNVAAASSTAGGGPRINIEVSVMQFFYNYLSQCSAAQVQESWSSLLGLLRDCLALAPPALFLALSVLNQFVLRAPAPSERKEQKELQDVAGKLIEACANIGGSCLEQTTWLRRNLQVKPELLADQERQAELDLIESSTKPTEGNELSSSLTSLVSSSASETGSKKSPGAQNSTAQFAVPALALLGELLAPFLDIIYNSEEKDRVVPLLHSVMYNVMPYLRNHSRGNLPSFRACSKLLASLSEYQYTRKSWKKDAVDLLLDPAFFQMDLTSLQQWRVTVDNLMTHDKTTFKELMTKVSSISQSGSLSLFSSKEQELEQRCLLLKRLAFVIFCSEVDQYQKQMPDIQERLAESLRTIPTSPSVQAAVFLCFRVILVRMSAQHVTSMWPLIITEMVQIFSYLEQELSTDSEEWSTHLKRLSTLDTSWVVSAGSNGLVAHNSPQWIALYLAVCKLLDLSLAMPALELPQFQMYRWAFVSESSVDPSLSPSSKKSAASGLTVVNGGNSKTPPAAPPAMSQQQDFVPYVVRVAKLLLSKIPHPVEPAELVDGEPQLTMTSISSLDDLAPFFASICRNVTRQQTKSLGSRGRTATFGESSANSRKGGGKKSAMSSSREAINALIEKDFLEALTK